MSNYTDSNKKYRTLRPEEATFPNMVGGNSSGNNNTQLTEQQKEQQKIVQEEYRKEQEELKKLLELRQARTSANYMNLPDDPIYKPVPDDILELNELNKNMATSIRIMTNVALNDYAVFRRIDENDNEENVRLDFKRVGYEDFHEYQDQQQTIDDLNNRIVLLLSQKDKTEQTYDRIREYQKQLKPATDEKVRKGLKVFFKKHSKYDLYDQRKEFDYNDLLLNCEIGYYRYIQSPFLRQSSTKSS